MTESPKLYFVFRSTFRPTGATYVGVYGTSDINFGTESFTDPYIGNGKKVVDLAKASGNRRNLWNVQYLRIGTKKDCDDYLKRLVDNMDLSNPLCLNSKEGYPVGRPLTQEHLENKAAALSVALEGNDNSLGHRPASIDLDLPGQQKLKWFNDGSQEKMLVCENDIPIKPEYKEWVLGKLNRAKKRVKETLTKEESNE